VGERGLYTCWSICGIFSSVREAMTRPSKASSRNQGKLLVISGGAIFRF
jgi:hypothetical protein